MQRLFKDFIREFHDVNNNKQLKSQVQDIHVLLTSNQSPVNIRDLKSDHMSRLVRVPGIIINASGVRAKATRLAGLLLNFFGFHC